MNDIIKPFISIFISLIVIFNRFNVIFILFKRKTIFYEFPRFSPNARRYSIVRLPDQRRTQKPQFFRTLQDMGLDDCPFQPHLDTLILNSLGMDEEIGEIFDAYYEIMERRSQKIYAGDDSMMAQALEAYNELVDQKRKQAAKLEVDRELQ